MSPCMCVCGAKLLQVSDLSNPHLFPLPHWQAVPPGKPLVVQSLSHVQLFANPWTAACQASLSITISWSLLKLISLESVRPSNHLILCGPLLILPTIFPSLRVFSTESALCIRWPKYWSFSFMSYVYQDNFSCVRFTDNHSDHWDSDKQKT